MSWGTVVKIRNNSIQWDSYNFLWGPSKSHETLHPSSSIVERASSNMTSSLPSAGTKRKYFFRHFLLTSAAASLSGSLIVFPASHSTCSTTLLWNMKFNCIQDILVHSYSIQWSRSYSLKSRELAPASMASSSPSQQLTRSALEWFSPALVSSHTRSSIKLSYFDHSKEKF